MTCGKTLPSACNYQPGPIMLFSSTLAAYLDYGLNSGDVAFDLLVAPWLVVG